MTPDSAYTSAAELPQFTPPDINDYLPQAPAAEPRGLVDELSAGVGYGVDTTQAALYGMAGLIGQGVGSERLTNYGFEGYTRNMEEAAPNAPTVGSVFDIEGVDDAASWLAHTLGQVAPQALASIVTGGAATAGTLATQVGLKAALFPTVGKLAAVNMAKGMAQKEASALAAQQIAKSIATGTFIGAIPQEVGSQWGQDATTYGLENTNPLQDLTFGVAAAAIEPFLGATGPVLRNILGAPVKDVVADSVGKAFKANILTYMGREGSTEALQDLTGMINFAIRDEEEVLTTDNVKQLVNSFVAGAVSGVPFSATSAAFAKRKEAEQTTEAKVNNEMLPVTEAQIETQIADQLGLNQADEVQADTQAEVQATEVSVSERLAKLNQNYQAAIDRESVRRDQLLEVIGRSDISKEDKATAEAAFAKTVARIEKVRETQKKSQEEADHILAQADANATKKVTRAQQKQAAARRKAGAISPEFADELYAHKRDVRVFSNNMIGEQQKAQREVKQSLATLRNRLANTTDLGEQRILEKRIVGYEQALSESQKFTAELAKRRDAAVRAIASAKETDPSSIDIAKQSLYSLGSQAKSDIQSIIQGTDSTFVAGLRDNLTKKASDIQGKLAQSTDTSSPNALQLQAANAQVTQERNARRAALQASVERIRSKYRGARKDQPVDVEQQRRAQQQATDEAYLRTLYANEANNQAIQQQQQANDLYAQDQAQEAMNALGAYRQQQANVQQAESAQQQANALRQQQLGRGPGYEVDVARAMSEQERQRQWQQARPEAFRESEQDQFLGRLAYNFPAPGRPAPQQTSGFRGPQPQVQTTPGTPRPNLVPTPTQVQARMDMQKTEERANLARWEAMEQDRAAGGGDKNITAWEQSVAPDRTQKEVSQVTKWLAPSLKMLPGLRDNVVVTANKDVLPEGHKDATAAFVNGKVYIMADKVKTKEQATKLLVHEGVVHYGLRAILSDKSLDALLSTVYNNFKGRAEWQRFEAARPNYKNSSPLVRAEEFVAYVAEKKKVKSLISKEAETLYTKVKNIIRRALRSMFGSKYKMTENDLLDIIRGSATYLAQENTQGTLRAKRDAVRFALGVDEETYSTYLESAQAKKADQKLFGLDKLWKDTFPTPKEGEVPTHTPFRKLYENVADSAVRMKDIQAYLKGTKEGAISMATNVYKKLEPLNNIVNGEIKNYHNQYVDVKTEGSLMWYVNKLVPKYGDFDLALAAATDYVTALHALERNAKMRTNLASTRKNGKVSAKEAAYLEDASGWSDDHASKIIAKYQDDPNMNAIKRVVQDINEARLTAIENYKLFDPRIVKEWRENYNYYVPLKKWDESAQEVESGYTGLKNRAGLSTGGYLPSKRAKGRKDLAENPIINSILQLEEVVRMGEKNKVGKAFLQLVNENPDPKLWEPLSKADSSFSLVAKKGGGWTYRKKNHKYSGKDVAIITVLDDNAERQLVAVHDPALARMLRSENLLVASPIVKTVGAMTRMMAQLSTTLSLPFILTNPIRDVQTAMLNLGSVIEEHGAETGQSIKAVRSQLLKDLGPAFRALWKDAKGIAMASETDKQWSDLIRMFRNAGAETSMIGLSNFDDLYTRLRKQARTPNKARDTITGACDYLRDLSDVLENVTRLSVFKNMRSVYINQMKYSDAEATERAANIALNLTVNFTKKGAWAPLMNAMYMFSSASIAGNVRAMQNLWRKTSTRQQNVMRVAKYFAVPIAAQFLLAGLCRGIMGEDEDGVNRYDKIPDYIRERNIIIPAPFGDGGYFKIPVALGYHIFWNAGNQVDQCVNGRISAGKAAASTVASMFDNFNLAGSPEEGWTALIPTPLRPLFQIASNTNFAGQPIMPAGDKKPDSQKYWGTTAQSLKTAAAWLNEATGGSTAKSGLIDVSPETIEHILMSYSGGMGRLIWDSVQTAGDYLTPEKEMDYTDIPIMNKFLGKVSEADTQRLYGELRNQVQPDILEYQQAVEQRSGVDRLREIRLNNAVSLRLQGALKATEKQLKALREQETRLRIQYGPYSSEFNKAQKYIQQRRDMIMQRFIGAYERQKV